MGAETTGMLPERLPHEVSRVERKWSPGWGKAGGVHSPSAKREMRQGREGEGSWQRQGALPRPLVFLLQEALKVRRHHHQPQDKSLMGGRQQAHL